MEQHPPTSGGPAPALGDATALTGGTLAYAYNLGDTPDVTVNTFTFDGTATGGVANLNGKGNVVYTTNNNGSNANFNNAGGDIEALLDSVQRRNPSSVGTITLGNLSSGTVYTV